jgi:hypothetical protein
LKLFEKQAKKTMALIILFVKLTSLLMLVMVINCGNSFDGCSKLSNNCPFEDGIDIFKNRFETFVCDSLNTNFEMSESEMAMCKKTPTAQTEVYFKLSIPQIFDRSLNSISLLKFIREMNFNKYKVIRYSNLKGFDLNTSLLSNNLNQNDFAINYNFVIYSSSFHFFLNNRLQASCDDFFKTNLTDPKSLFHTRQINLFFENIEFSEKPICPLFFKNVHLAFISIKYQINTFYKRNYLKFSRINNSDINFLNTSIESLWTKFNEKIDIDSNSFLNKYIFNSIDNLLLMGEINSIEKDIFKPFKKLKMIYLETIYFGKLSRKGIEWISSINSDLHVNLSNRSELDLYVNQTTTIILFIYSISNNEIDKIKIFQDEDFCLFKNYPFDQLVFFQIAYIKRYFSLKYTCTVQWIQKYLYLYSQYPQLRKYNYIYDRVFFDFIASNKTNNSNQFEKCDFKKMIDNCNRTKFEIRDDEWTINDTKEVSILIEVIFIVLLPIVCLCGLISNVMIIFTLSLKENEKDFKKVHYPYLKMVCVSNMVVLIIKILSPIYECQSHQGIFCSSIYMSLFAQYYKIIFGEFLCSVFSMISNFGYVGFSMTRLSLVGKDHSKLIKFISELSMSYYIIVSTIISVALSVAKIFHYQVNVFDPNQDYPIQFDRNFNNIYSPDPYFATKARVINVLNAVSDITNYFLFILVNIILDIILVRKLKKALSGKLNSDVEKTTQAIFRMIVLVVSFALFSIILKFPASLKSIFDSIHLNNKIDIEGKPFTDNHIDYLYEWFCVYPRFCPTFDKLASILFTISISANIFFYYMFDKNFKFGLKIAINKLISKKEKHLEYVKSLEESRAKT